MQSEIFEFENFENQAFPVHFEIFSKITNHAVIPCQKIQRLTF